MFLLLVPVVVAGLLLGWFAVGFAAEGLKSILTGAVTLGLAGVLSIVVVIFAATVAIYLLTRIGFVAQYFDFLRDAGRAVVRWGDALLAPVLRLAGVA